MEIHDNFWRSKTTLLGLAGVFTAIATALTVYAEKGDWKAALTALGVALFSGLAVTIRDAIAKNQAAIVASNDGVKEELQKMNASADSPPIS